MAHSNGYTVQRPFVPIRRRPELPEADQLAGLVEEYLTLEKAWRDDVFREVRLSDSDRALRRGRLERTAAQIQGWVDAHRPGIVDTRWLHKFARIGDIADGRLMEVLAPVWHVLGQLCHMMECSSNRNLGAEQTESQTNQQVIEELERETPNLDTKSVEWLAARRKNVEKLGLALATLRTYRLVSSGGRKMPDEMFGIDRDGRRWRRKGTTVSMVYYYVPSLPKASNKASN